MGLDHSERSTDASASRRSPSGSWVPPNRRAKLAAMPDKPSTPEICDRPGRGRVAERDDNACLPQSRLLPVSDRDHQLRGLVKIYRLSLDKVSRAVMPRIYRAMGEFAIRSINQPR